MLWFAPQLLLPALWLALVLEALWGEPRRWHPLVGFGRLAQWLEQRCNTGRMGIARGGLCVLILVVIPAGVFAAGLGLLQTQAQTMPLSASHWASSVAAVLGHGFLLWFALGARSLHEHVIAIWWPLQARDLPAARAALQRIVSRDCAALEHPAIARGAIESTLENGADAVFASLCWFILLGGPGALLHRLANTLDAMWGYRTPRLNQFGRVAARLDDVLNVIPARLTALSYALLGQTRLALHCWWRQAPEWDSPNAGPVMASGAGALGVALGGPAVYHGRLEERPILGAGRVPQAADVRRALWLVQRCFALQLALAVLLLVLQWWWR
ncbi:adenosylcobinamide-phosphate synthase CbiB [Chitinibacter tainanensis]|uniref:adenosylcobinamide-phosphate synthase CbiB n=1 Tax=Chitinibacter tainanensis TaxID=230667 RepID=UPI000410B04A|nr:adenosylcobinamide-phosphate synthase CbiB [Chitinibacter tainanensis]